MNWIQRLFKSMKGYRPAKTASSQVPSTSPLDAAKSYLAKVHKKMDKLASDFANGMINRTQFQNLYSHYQREIVQIESVIESHPESWENVSTEGQSVIIRRQHMACAQAYAIYVNETGLPIGILGKFKLDPALVVPMLSSYRTAAKEIFGSGLRLTQIEDGQWLCFVSGQYTTLLAVFINEPIPKQLEYLNELHHHFEVANQPILVDKPIRIDGLIYPHEYFLGKWQR